MGVFVSFRGVFDGEHRQVVALFLFAHKLAHLAVHLFDDVFWSGLCCIGQHLFDAGDAELLVRHVLGLGQSVGVEEYGGVFLEHGLLRLELEVVEQSEGDVRNHRQGRNPLVGRLVENIGDVVTCIAIAEQSGGQVKYADEEGDEDVLLVAFARSGVQRLHDVGGVGLMHRGHAEHGVHFCHDDG